MLSRSQSDKSSAFDWISHTNISSSIVFLAELAKLDLKLGG